MSHCTPILLPFVVGICVKINKIVENKILLSIFYPLMSFIMKYFLMSSEYKTATNIIVDFYQKSFIVLFELSIRYTYHLQE